MDGHPWPLFDIRIWTERLELRLPTEPELIELLELAQSGIHDPNEMPFGFAWTDQPESGGLLRPGERPDWAFRPAASGPGVDAGDRRAHGCR